MFDINLSFKHGRTQEEARIRLGEAVAEVQSRFGSMVRQVQWDTDHNAVHLSGTGFEVDAWVEFSFSGGAALWIGHFVLPEGGSVKVGKTLRLTDDGGRTGRIKIASAPWSSNPAAHAHFKVIGPFGKPA